MQSTLFSELTASEEANLCGAGGYKHDEKDDHKKKKYEYEFIKVYFYFYKKDDKKKDKGYKW